MEHIKLCCLIDDNQKCSRAAGNAAYNKRIQRNVAQQKLKLLLDGESPHNNICEFHKHLIQSYMKRKRRDSEEENSVDAEGLDHGSQATQPDVELINLQMNTLRRFKKHYKITTRPGINKGQLVEILMKSFRTMPVSEKECLTYFIYMIKNNRSKFDQRGGAGGGHVSNPRPSSPEM